MFDLGWTELVFLIILALVVVGPKDLPRLARGVGEIASRLQRFVRQAQFNLKRLENEIETSGQRPKEGVDLLPDYVRQRLAGDENTSSEQATSVVSGRDHGDRMPEPSTKQ